MKSSERQATAASFRRYAILYAAFVLFHCWAMYTNPKPIQTITVVSSVLFAFGVLLMMSQNYLRVVYGLIILGIIAAELIFRDTAFKPWLFVEGGLAVLLGALAFRNKKALA